MLQVGVMKLKAAGCGRATGSLTPNCTAWSQQESYWVSEDDFESDTMSEDEVPSVLQLCGQRANNVSLEGYWLDFFTRSRLP